MEQPGINPLQRMQYKYEPLQQGHIRILVLEPGQFGEPLYAQLEHCGLSIVSSLPTEGVSKSPTDSSKSDRENSDDDEDEPLDVDGEDSLNNRYTSIWDHFIASNPQYVALSYAWGSPDLTQSLNLDSMHTISVPQSLYDALQHLRWENESRRLWVDAICINQQDIDEKSLQVARIGDIFKAAEYVLAWLGKSEGFDYLALALIDEISGDPTISKDEVVATALCQYSCNCVCCYNEPPESPKQAFDLAIEALRSLGTRSWFERLWVLPESALAVDLWYQSGAHIISLQDAENLRFWHDYSRSDLDIGEGMGGSTHVISTSRNALQGFDDVTNVRAAVHQGRLSLPYTIFATWSRQCTEPQDRLFACKGILSSHVMSNIEVDYSMTAVDLFSKVTVNALSFGSTDSSKEENVAYLLALAPTTHHESNKDFSSWVPDYNNCSHVAVDQQHNRYSDEYLFTFEAHGHIRCQSRPTRPELMIAGHCIGSLSVLPDSQISQVFELIMVGTTLETGGMHHDRSLDTWFTQCSIFENGAQLVKGANLSSIPYQTEPYFECSTAGVDSNGVTEGEDSLHAFAHHLANTARDQWFHTNKLLLLLLHAIRAGQIFVDRPSLLVETVHKIFQASSLLCMHIGPDTLLAIVEINGATLFGWVPAKTEPGDQLCIIYGAPYPFVIRKIPGEESYRLIGDTSFPELTEELATATDPAHQGWICLRCFVLMHVRKPLYATIRNFKSSTWIELGGFLSNF